MDIRDLTMSEWERHLPTSGFEVFHTPEALSVLGSHTRGEMRLLGGFKGDAAVALLPVFVRETIAGRAVLSPPPEMGVPRLGPLITPNSPKRSKQESVTRRFVDGVVEELEADGPLSVLRLQCGLDFDDPRPFDWREFSVDPAFTYVLEVDGSSVDGVLESFSRSRRREFRQAEEADLTATREDGDAAVRIVRQVNERYDEHDDMGGVAWPYVRDLLDALPERSRVYVARDADGEYLGGIITLASNDAVHYWQGGVGGSYEEDGSSISVNAVLHRAIISDILTDPELESVGSYDLVGANTRRLCEYKAKFGGRLAPYYVVESSGAATTLAKAGYRLLARR